MDKYARLRDLPFPTVASLLGIDMSRFKERKGGTEWAGACPIHRPKRNSTSFSYSQNGAFNCFSCSAKGRGAIDLAKAVRGVGFQEAVSLLEPYADEIDNHPKTVVNQIVNRTAELSTCATENPAKSFTYEKYYVPSTWLSERRISAETAAKYGVGLYDNPTRQSAYRGKILLRIQRWADGAIVGYLARDPRPAEERGDAPKYVMPAGLHKGLELWGAWQLKEKAPIRILYLVESPFSVMKFHQLGLPAVSPFGWSLSAEQIAILGELAKGVVCLPDRDKQEAFAPFAHALSKVVWTKCPHMPDGVGDPEYLTLDQIRALT